MEYDRGVKRSAQRPVPASHAALNLLLSLSFLWLTFTSLGFAQANGVGHSGAHAQISAPPIASHNWVGSASIVHIIPKPPSTTHNPPAPKRPGPGSGASAGVTGYSYPYLYAVPFPYPVTADATDQAPADDSADDQGGPTVFDRRGSGAESYVPPVDDSQANAMDDAADAEAPIADARLEPPQPQTTLVFKDGHELSVDNYAIVSQTLYDLTPGHARKIALADLDLQATEKQNDDRGVSFQVPPAPQAN
jgi:hypothetical protein